MVQKAYAFAADELDRFKRQNDVKLIGRYQRLVDYFERRVHVWLT